MSSYLGRTEGHDRAKAVAAVIAVHAALAFIILSGLNMRSVSRAVERLTTIEIRQPPPPPPVQPPPKPQAQAPKNPEGAAAKKAEPSPIVAPQSRLPVQSPIPAAKVAGAGSASSSGSALAGNGTGAGGSGSGSGGGGTGSFTPAQKITKIPNSEYRRLVFASGMDRGSVGVSITVTADGRATRCRVVRSSGNRVADGLMCQLTEEYVRFRPALDPQGRPVAQEVTWYPNWWRP